MTGNSICGVDFSHDLQPNAFLYINLDDLFAKIEELVLSERAPGEGMREILAQCARDFPHDDWSRLAQLDYDGDVASLAGWIGGVFDREPAPFPIQGLWFGLFNPAEGEKTWADIYVGGMAEYEPGDKEMSWLYQSDRHFPKNAEAHSVGLRQIHEIAYGGGLGNTAEYPLCLAFGAFAVRALLRGQTTKLVGSTAPVIGVVVGFDSGDMVKVGELTPTNFVPCGKAG